MPVNKSAIEQAAESGDLEALNTLLDTLNLDVRILNNAFILAARNGHLAVVERLLIWPANPAHNYFQAAIRVVKGLFRNAKVDYSWCNHYAFIGAARNGHLAIVERLLSLDKPDVDYSKRNSDAFIEAAENGHLAVVERLLSLDKPDAEHRARNHEAFIAAASRGHLAIVERLLSLDKPDDNYIWRNDAAFALAAENGHLAIVERLLSLDKPDADYSKRNDKAFIEAARNGHLAIVERLLVLKPPVDYRARNDEVFKWAVYYGHLAIVERLLTLPGINPAVNNFEEVVRALENNHRPVVDAIARWVRVHGSPQMRVELDAILGGRGIVVNYGQSIHNIAVHKSVSESAIRLMERYGEKIAGEKLSVVLRELIAYVDTLDAADTPTDINGAAKRYLANVLSNATDSRFLFVDKDSKVSTQQILALTYLAALDTERHPKVSKEVALQYLVKGLYEAQRGYNLNDKDVDDGVLRDSVICTPGAFNKAVEVLAVWHPDVEIRLVTKAQAGVKLPRVIIQKVKDYLALQLEGATTEIALIQFKELIEKLKGDKEGEGLECIYSLIEEQVANELFDEFKEIYDNNRENNDFKDLIASGKDLSLSEVMLGDLDTFKEQAESKLLQISPITPVMFSDNNNTDKSKVQKVQDKTEPSNTSPKLQ